MKKLAIFLIFVPLLGFSQHPVSYKLHVSTTDFFYGKELFIAPAIFTPTNEFNENKIKTFSTVVTKNEFELHGSIKYATPVSFSYPQKEAGKIRIIISDFLFLDQGSLQVSLNDLATDKEIRGQITSAANSEYKALRRLYKYLEVDNGSRTIIGKTNVEKKDKILQAYIKSHPGSYVAMWVLIYDYQLYGYSNTKNEITRLFSKKIRNTSSFKALLAKIKADKSLMVNYNFPFYNFIFGGDVENMVTHSNYTLVDFWSSYCKPCIAQFPELQRIHNYYQPKGFAVYTIATDRKQDTGKIDSIVASQKIAWHNEKDINGLQSLRLNITGIPRNFLLDAKGKIVATDLSMQELELFLKKNFPVKELIN